MTYLELYYKARRQLENNEIAFDEYKEMTKALDEEIEDRKVGKWIQTRKPSGLIGYKCSNCDFFYPFILGLNYCPNCGTEMRGVENENN